MFNFEIEGKLLAKETVEQKDASNQFNEFVVEVVDNFQPQYIKFRLELSLYYLLDKIEVGQNLKVQFDIIGEEQEGKVVTTLRAINIKHLKGFKYQAEIDLNGLQDCPPSDFQEIQMLCYRFVFENVLHPNNFLPAYLINPARVNNAKDLTSKCAGFGLSLFQSPQGAKSKFVEMMAGTKGNFFKLVGNHLATIMLFKEDGIGDQPNMDNFSHFTFHEYAEADLKRQVKSIEKI